MPAELTFAWNASTSNAHATSRTYHSTSRFLEHAAPNRSHAPAAHAKTEKLYILLCLQMPLYVYCPRPTSNFISHSYADAAKASFKQHTRHHHGRRHLRPAVGLMSASKGVSNFTADEDGLTIESTSEPHLPCIVS